MLSMSPSDQRSTARLAAQHATRRIEQADDVRQRVGRQFPFVFRTPDRFVDVFGPAFARRQAAQHGAQDAPEHAQVFLCASDRPRPPAARAAGSRWTTRRSEPRCRGSSPARLRHCPSWNWLAAASPAIRRTVSGLRAQSTMNEPGCLARSTDTINVDAPPVARMRTIGRIGSMLSTATLEPGTSSRQSGSTAPHSVHAGRRRRHRSRATTCSAALTAATGVSGSRRESRSSAHQHLPPASAGLLVTF